ncbi:MAG TPA: NADPH:quinone reductase [Longimicrobiaceae bacterium]
MRAIVVEQFGEPDVLRLSDVPDPRPGPREVLVRVRAVGVNPVDAYRRSGQYGRLPPLPYTPGSDAAGEIDAVGVDVSRWRPGDRVYTDHSVSGAYASLVRCREDQVHPLPPVVSFAQGAALGVPYATAFRALFLRGGARAGERLLVHGATGGVGLAALQLAHAAGLRITGTGGSAGGREAARMQGADEVLDHRAPDHADRLRAAVGERGFELVLEMLADVNLPLDLQVLAPGGRIVIIGSRGSVELEPRAIMAREADVRGMTLFSTPPEDVALIHAALHTGLENGTLRPVIAAELPLEEAAEGHRRVMAPGHTGKIVLVP